MKKYLLAVTLMVTLGLTAACGAAGVSGDVTATTVEEESVLFTEEEELQESGEVMTVEGTDDPQAPAETEVMSVEEAE